jgi:hypothetical protein
MYLKVADNDQLRSSPVVTHVWLRWGQRWYNTVLCCCTVRSQRFSCQDRSSISSIRCDHCPMGVVIGYLSATFAPFRMERKVEVPPWTCLRWRIPIPPKILLGRFVFSTSRVNEKSETTDDSFILLTSQQRYRIFLLGNS